MRRLKLLQIKLAVKNDFAFAGFETTQGDDVLPGVLQDRCDRRCLAGATTMIMPIPQLKVRSISGWAMRPACANQRKMGKTGTAARSIRAQIPSGSTRGILSGKPPPVMWASAFTPVEPRNAARHAAT